MDNGVILKALSGFYYVNIDGRTVQCRARGRFRHENIVPLVGDRVVVSFINAGEGVIDEILPRKNAFTRPPVANVDQIVIMAANVNPITDVFLIDQMSALTEYSGAEALICINKCDLDPAARLYKIYTAVGYRTIRTSALTGEGTDELLDSLRGKVSVLTGNSGVGKSSLLNVLNSSLELTTGEVSDKLGRGRHTTRHVEMFEVVPGAIVADTPGFSSFDLSIMYLAGAEELPKMFREFAPFLQDCQFTGCSHRKEKGCAVLAAMSRGEIQETRHTSYVRLYNKLKEIPEWELKRMRSEQKSNVLY